MALDARQQPAFYGRWPQQHDFRHLKTQAAVGNLAHTSQGSDVIVCAEMDEQWGIRQGLNRASAGCLRV